MKWEIIASSANQETYVLAHNNQKLLSLDFHPFTNSARIEYANEKRVFLIRKEGFLRNKTVLRNEYGIRIGQVGYDKSNPSSGVLELNDEKFFYDIQTYPKAELIIFKDSKNNPFVTCDFQKEEKNASINITNQNKLGPAQHFLLMALCWYMFLPVAKNKVAEYELS